MNNGYSMSCDVACDFTIVCTLWCCYKYRSHYCVCFFSHWRAECERRRNGRKARLWMALYKCIWWRFTISGVLQFLEVRQLLYFFPNLVQCTCTYIHVCFFIDRSDDFTVATSGTTSRLFCHMHDANSSKCLPLRTWSVAACLTCL